MRIKLNKPIRKFFPSKKKDFSISDCAKIFLEDNEQVTFVNKNNMNYDLASKNWGYYSTPSVNNRLVREGFKTALMQNRESNNIYVTLVDKSKMDEFKKYLKNENCFVIEWLNKRKD